VPSEPTDDELIAFADSVMGDLGDSYLDADLLSETITEQRDVWRNLYRISRGNPHTAELRARGIVFEEYDLPDVKTVDGIADHASGASGAWFKDPDGNILQIGHNQAPACRPFLGGGPPCAL